MPDIRLVPYQTNDIVTMDWLQTPVGLLDESAELASAVMVALCSDAVALPSDELPDPNSTDLRGWWGDTDAEIIWNGWPIGSKLWLMTRSAIVGSGARLGSTMLRLQTYIQTCMQPFVTARLCSRFTVQMIQVNQQRIDALITIYRGPKTAIALQFQSVWAELYPTVTSGR